MMNCEEKFVELYHRSPDAVAFCPYRICPLGAHVDHNFGKVTGIAIDRGIYLAYSVKQNGVVELGSLQFEKRAQWHIFQAPATKQGDWADYLRGATLILSERYPLKKGLSGIIEGTLPIGGLSSSAAVVLAFLKALCSVNNISLEYSELVEISVAVENKYVGVSCGTLDQSCELLSHKDKLLYLDTSDGRYELVPFGDGRRLPFSIAVIFSGLERNLSGSRFNQRVDEAKAAAYALKSFSGMDYDKFDKTTLRDVPYAVYQEYAGRLPERWRLRAEHWYCENIRVEAGVEAWKKGDVEAFGRLVFESGRSSIDCWETGSPELISLYEIMTRTEGIYGGRFSGAGFKGCCLALVDPARIEAIEREVSESYTKLYPELKERYSFHICESVDGLEV